MGHASGGTNKASSAVVAATIKLKLVGILFKLQNLDYFM